ncbi:uncharacterized protein L969DRAFT_611451, partial [Mixia osmundae IAM 14324]|uniref:uncharacterized protein n=1 Tax=Mixia osmundae (strain CBS 9802 / IAM 14324 / JCM 22182 / KY 12970) TaxID=764103 RepID=UPI0004A55917
YVATPADPEFFDRTVGRKFIRFSAVHEPLPLLSLNVYLTELWLLGVRRRGIGSSPPEGSFLLLLSLLQTSQLPSSRPKNRPLSCCCRSRKASANRSYRQASCRFLANSFDLDASVEDLRSAKATNRHAPLQNLIIIIDNRRKSMFFHRR